MALYAGYMFYALRRNIDVVIKKLLAGVNIAIPRLFFNFLELFNSRPSPIAIQKQEIPIVEFNNVLRIHDWK